MRQIRQVVVVAAAILVLVGVVLGQTPRALAQSLANGSHGKHLDFKWPTNMRPGQAIFVGTTTPGCSGSGCNYQDPITEGCTNPAYLQGTANDPNGRGYVQNWYSTACQTNWTVVQANSGSWIYEADAFFCSYKNAQNANASGCPYSGGQTTAAQYTIEDTAAADCSPLYGMPLSYHCNLAGAIPWNTTHWYTNMWYSPSGSNTSVKSDAMFAPLNSSNYGALVSTRYF